AGVEAHAEGQLRGLRRIAAMRVPGHGLGLAINDRLARAAAPRDQANSAIVDAPPPGPLPQGERESPTARPSPCGRG
ncbi:MAG TPA: hypothetical protein VJ779_11490, partial [Acetobacteraceae bacterium]|nr:hypothetical protein [Acetobacteraceae bacterium]